MKYDIFSYSSIGKRLTNEDAYDISDINNTTLIVLADGVGGHNYGEFASKQVITSMKEWLRDQELSEKEMEQAIQYANHVIHSKHSLYPNARSTIAAVWLDGNKAFAMNIGDTRIYHFREYELLYQSKDHSMAQLAVNAGEMEACKIRESTERNILFRALGSEQLQRPEKRKLSLKSGDRLLLCTDGFWEIILESEMIKKMEPTDTAEIWLQKMCNKVEPEAKDNNTAIGIIIR